jgi:hypothetical protein
MLVNAGRYNSAFLVLPLVPRDAFRPPLTTHTNFKLSGMQQKLKMIVKYKIHT